MGPTSREGALPSLSAVEKTSQKEATTKAALRIENDGRRVVVGEQRELLGVRLEDVGASGAEPLREGGERCVGGVDRDPGAAHTKISGGLQPQISDHTPGIGAG